MTVGTNKYIAQAIRESVGACVGDNVVAWNDDYDSYFAIGSLESITTKTDRNGTYTTYTVKTCYCPEPVYFEHAYQYNGPVPGADDADEPNDK